MINSLITLSKPTFAFFFITMGIAGFVAVIFRDIRRHLVRLILVAMLFICSYYALRVAMQFDFARGILKSHSSPLWPVCCGCGAASPWTYPAPPCGSWQAIAFGSHGAAT